MNLFRLALSLVLLIMIVPNVNAQKLEFGLTGGINFSSHLNEFRYTIEENAQMQLSPQITDNYQVGLILRNSFSHSVRLQAEPSLIYLGATYDGTFSIRGHELQTQSQTEFLYLQLPLLLQFSTVPSQYKVTASPQYRVHGSGSAVTTFHISGGIFGGYLLDARFSGRNYGAPLGISFEENFSNDITPDYSEFEGGVMLGLGFEHGNNSKLGLETRALYSIFKSDDVQQNSSFDIQNYALTLSVYFLF